MESSDYWRLCEELSIFQAIMLKLGYDPSNQKSYDVENSKIEDIPKGYGALKTALVNAIASKQIEGTITEQQFDYRNNELEAPITDLDNSIIEVASLKEYLTKHGHNEGFFFSGVKTLEAYLDNNNPYFAPKLSAAIHAWKAVTEDVKLLNGKTPKQALGKHLRDNAKQYGLIKNDETINETGIEEICKIANWKPEGGASRTPTHGMVNDNPPTPSTNTVKLKVFGQKLEVKIDDYGDDCPF